MDRFFIIGANAGTFVTFKDPDAARDAAIGVLSSHPKIGSMTVYEVVATEEVKRKARGVGNDGGPRAA